MSYLVPAFSSFLRNSFIRGHPFLSVRMIFVSERRDVCIYTALFSSPASKEQVEMTTNAIACLEECCSLNQNMASDRALDFACVLGFLFILVDILVLPMSLNLGSTRLQQCHMDQHACVFMVFDTSSVLVIYCGSTVIIKETSSQQIFSYLFRTENRTI